MTQLPDDTPAIALFPMFENQLFDWTVDELDGLTDEQLDFESHMWLWSQWSIRRQVSHVASGHVRWLSFRWGNLFPDGMPEIEDYDWIMSLHYRRRLDFYKYWNLKDILRVLKQGLDMCHSVVTRETVGSMRAKEVEVARTFEQNMMAQASINVFGMANAGVREHPTDDLKKLVTLEYNLRHRYWEHITHIYNIQRIKRLLELPTKVEIPYEGYWAQPDWDRSEAGHPGTLVRRPSL